MLPGVPHAPRYRSFEVSFTESLASLHVATQTAPDELLEPRGSEARTGLLQNDIVRRERNAGSYVAGREQAPSKDPPELAQVLVESQLVERVLESLVDEPGSLDEAPKLLDRDGSRHVGPEAPSREDDVDLNQVGAERRCCQPREDPPE